jgi:hypothetical protein
MPMSSSRGFKLPSQDDDATDAGSTPIAGKYQRLNS